MESSTEEWRSNDEDSIGRFFVRDTWPSRSTSAERRDEHYILESEATFRSQCTVAWHVCAYGITGEYVDDRREERRGEEKRSFCRTSAPSIEESGANNLANCRQRIFKFEHRISLGPPARGHRVNQSEDSSALVRVTKNRIRAFEKGKSTLSFSFCLFLSSPATSLCICMRKSIAAED